MKKTERPLIVIIAVLGACAVFSLAIIVLIISKMKKAIAKCRKN